jgi:AmmeMemoRadiSam system protein B
MTNVRPTAVAGTFYPGDEVSLRRTVKALLGAATPSHHAKILIAPHAGYIYSGPVAASAFAALRQRREITRVVLFGPVHRVFFEGIAVPSSRAFATPLGVVPLEAPPVGVITSDGAHAQEHSLEVEVPFLQVALPSSFTLLPLLCGHVEPAGVARVMQAVWGGDETLIVISSDLSHYLPYVEAQRVDAETAAQVLALRSELTHEQACGATALNAALMVARERAMRAQVLDLRTSADTAGDKARVVGYASFAIA